MLFFPTFDPSQHLTPTHLSPPVAAKPNKALDITS